MWITTSKWASETEKALARRLAAHLPQGRFVPRGERALERLEALAARAGERALGVLSRADREGGVAARLRTRRRGAVGGEMGRWEWERQELAVRVFSWPARPPRVEPEEPFALDAAGAEALAVARLLGLEDAPLAQHYDPEARTPLRLEASEGSARLRRGEEDMLAMEYALRPLGGKGAADTPAGGAEGEEGGGSEPEGRGGKARDPTTGTVSVELADGRTAERVARLLKRQLESVGRTRVEGRTEGARALITPEADTPANQRAAEFTARRLGRIVAGIDALRKPRA